MGLVVAVETGHKIDPGILSAMRHTEAKPSESDRGNATNQERVSVLSSQVIWHVGSG